MLKLFRTWGGAFPLLWVGFFDEFITAAVRETESYKKKFFPPRNKLITLILSEYVHV